MIIMPWSNEAVLDKIIGSDTVVDVNLDNTSVGSIQINVASPSGNAFYSVVGLECSNDGVNFVTVSGSYQTIDVSGYTDEQSHLIHMDTPDYKYARVNLSEVSGLGDVTVIPYLKGSL